MDCVRGFLFIFSLYIILSTFYIKHIAGKKEILGEGTCFDWFERSAAESSNSPMWSIGPDKKTCTVCNPFNTKKSWLITKMVNTKGYKLIHVHVDILSKECKNCHNQDVKILFLTQTLPVQDKKKSQEILNKLPLLTTLQNNEDEKSQTHHFQFESTVSEFSIVFLSQGSCTKVEKIKISFFVCEKNVSNGVYLPQTVAPASGFTRVNVSCPENTVDRNNMETYALCSSEGTWKIISPCMCKKGFTLAVTKQRCNECQVNTYKNSVGNGKCNACPRNSKSDTGQHRCLCKDGFYRFMGDDITHPCHGIPSRVRNIKLVHKTETSITLSWKPPERSGAPDQDVLYDVECKKCQSGSDSKPCEDPCGTKVQFIPRQSNLTNTSVTVQNLDQDSEYEFVIYSKNLNSLRINNRNWENIKKKIKTEAKTKSSISTIIVSVLVCVIFLLIVSYGIVKYKRRRRTPKLSNPVSFPVDTVERELFAEQNQDNGEPRYVTHDKLGTARFEEVPNLVRSDEIRLEMSRGETNNLHEEKTQILEPSANAALDKNRQDSRDTRNYQKLLKPDSDYLIPNDGGTETYENV